MATTCEIVFTCFGGDPSDTTRRVRCRTHDLALYEGRPTHIGSAEGWGLRCHEARHPVVSNPLRLPVTVEDLRKAAAAVYLVCDAVVADDLNRLLRAAADAMQERDDLRARLETPPC